MVDVSTSTAPPENTAPTSTSSGHTSASTNISHSASTNSHSTSRHEHEVTREVDEQEGTNDVDTVQEVEDAGDIVQEVEQANNVVNNDEPEAEAEPHHNNMKEKMKNNMEKGDLIFEFRISIKSI